MSNDITQVTPAVNGGGFPGYRTGYKGTHRTTAFRSIVRRYWGSSIALLLSAYVLVSARDLFVLGFSAAAFVASMVFLFATAMRHVTVESRHIDQIGWGVFEGGEHDSTAGGESA